MTGIDLELIDGLYSKGKTQEAEEKLGEWYDAARAAGDDAALLTVCNELAGLYRVTGRAAQGVSIADEAAGAIERLGLAGSVQHATTLLNAATVCRAAGKFDRAADLYKQAGGIYEALGDVDPYYTASLHNNLSQLYGETGRYELAVEELSKAQAVIDEAYPDSAEAAVSRVNASLYLMALGRIDEAEAALDKAKVFFGSPEGQNDSHLGAALSARGQLCYLKGDITGALSYYERARDSIFERFGDSDEFRLICSNIDKLRN